MKKLLLLMIIGTLSFTMVGCADELLEETSAVEETVSEPEAPEADEAEEKEIAEEPVSQETEEAEAVEETVEEGPCPYEDAPLLTFATEDIDGHAISTEDLAEANLVMVNFWEPWCGPCVGEMPDLETLYEEYKSQKFVILGVFQTEGMDGDVRDVMDSCGTTYPILRYVSSMEPFTTEYVPTTVFMDSHGHVLTEEPFVGSNSYDDWKQIIEQYLNR